MEERQSFEKTRNIEASILKKLRIQSSTESSVRWGSEQDGFAKGMREEFLGEGSLGEKYMGEKYVQEEFLGEESLGEKYMGEKYVQEEFLDEKSVQ